MEAICGLIMWFISEGLSFVWENIWLFWLTSVFAYIFIKVDYIEKLKERVEDLESRMGDVEDNDVYS